MLAGVPAAVRAGQHLKARGTSETGFRFSKHGNTPPHKHQLTALGTAIGTASAHMCRVPDRTHFIAPDANIFTPAAGTFAPTTPRSPPIA